MSLLFEIKELGPIRDSEFEFKPFSIFTGESNLGKSYTAFLIYGFFKLIEEPVFKHFVNGLFDFTELSKLIAKGDTKTLIFKKKEFEKYLNDNISYQIAYLTGNELFSCKVNIHAKFDDFEIKINSPEELRKKVGNGIPFLYADGKQKGIGESLTGQNEESLLGIFHHLIYEILLKRIFDKEWLGTIILPPGRGAVYPSSFTMKKNIANTGMYNDFLEKMDEINAPSPLKIENHELIEDLLFEIFQGKIIIEKDKFYYDFGGQKIPLQSAASSIKELAPLNLVLLKSRLDQISVLLEEPEAHLHPRLQRKIASLLALFVNLGGFLQITTHSDYFLNQINNLIKLSILKEKGTARFDELMEKLIVFGVKEEMILDVKKVGAYYFVKREDGSVVIKTQNLQEEAIPFDTFEKTVDGMMDETELINEFFYA